MNSLQIIKDTIQNKSEQIIKTVENKNTESFNWWFVIAIIEVVIILFLLFKLSRAKKNALLGDKFSELKNAKSSNVNMSDLMNDINGSRDLYKQLSKKCHPDRFQNTGLKEKADALFQEISSNKRNFSKLTELQKRAENELNINFNKK